MKTVKVNEKGKEVVFNLPTSLSEISDDYLKAITDNIEVANHHTLIGIVHHAKLNRLAIAYYTKKKSVTTNVIPVFIKCGKTDIEFLNNADIKDKLLIPESDIAIGYHVVVPRNELSIDKVIGSIVNNTSKEEYESLTMSNDDKEVYFIEFKIVTNTAIKAIYKPYKGSDDDMNYQHFVEVK